MTSNRVARWTHEGVGRGEKTGEAVPAVGPRGCGLSRTWVLAALDSRLVLRPFFQVSIATLYAARGSPAPWRASIGWWPITAILANLVGIALLEVLYRGEGGRYLDLFRLRRGAIGRNLLLTLGLLVSGAFPAIVPNVALATLLRDLAERPLGLLVHPLPAWAAVAALVLFPVTTGLAEMPTYCGYVLPRLEALYGSLPAAIVATALVHSL
jgi:hypothetical protein